jgi:hypothetical protein
MALLIAPVDALRLARIPLAGSKQTGMPRSKEFLLEQIARAKRFARAMNTDADRQRFEKMAADYQSAAERQSETANSNAADPTASAEGDQGSTTD